MDRRSPLHGRASLQSLTPSEDHLQRRKAPGLQGRKDARHQSRAGNLVPFNRRCDLLNGPCLAEHERGREGEGDVDLARHAGHPVDGMLLEHSAVLELHNLWILLDLPKAHVMRCRTTSGFPSGSSSVLVAKRRCGVLRGRPGMTPQLCTSGVEISKCDGRHTRGRFHHGPEDHERRAELAEDLVVTLPLRGLVRMVRAKGSDGVLVVARC
mmetsp:Transcript_67984/g.160029  ORF Transcript_67984/g.160029 Transcript_67984/m.160029 type:complete len:211 (-) Transcript_67984:257-889(-)